MKFSILIPTWKSLDYLALCLKALDENSSFYDHEVLIYHNEEKHVAPPDFKDNYSNLFVRHIGSIRNEGVSKPLNQLAKRASNDLLFYLNDDMVVGPGWDIILLERCKKLAGYPENFIGMCHWVVPEMSNKWPFYTLQNFGETPEDFKYVPWDSYIRNGVHLVGRHGSGQTFETCMAYYNARPPYLIPKALWNKVEGMDESLLAAHDDDFMWRCVRSGCSDYVCFVESAVYHFERCLTLKAMKTDARWKDGHEVFLKKWGLRIDQLNKDKLQVGRPYAD